MNNNPHNNTNTNNNDVDLDPAAEAAAAAAGGAPTLAQMGAVVRRWRLRRAELARLLELQTALRAEQRADDARIRRFMEDNDRDQLPTSAPGPDGRPVHTGTIWLSNARAAPKPITKQHLTEVLAAYDRIDEVHRAHLAAYIWEQREFGPEEVKVNFQLINHDNDEPTTNPAHNNPAHNDPNAKKRTRRTNH